MDQPFDLGGGVPGADDMRDDFYLVAALDGGTYRHGGDPAADDLPLEGPVCLGDILEFVTVGRDIDIAGTELHERLDAVQELILGNAAQRRDNLKGGEGMAGIQEVGDIITKTKCARNKNET